MVHPMDSTLEYSLERCIGTIALQVHRGAICVVNIVLILVVMIIVSIVVRDE